MLDWCNVWIEGMVVSFIVLCNGWWIVVVVCCCLNWGLVIYCVMIYVLSLIRNVVRRNIMIDI